MLIPCKTMVSQLMKLLMPVVNNGHFSDRIEEYGSWSGSISENIWVGFAKDFEVDCSVCYR